LGQNHPVDRLVISSRRRHTISKRDWSSDVCSSDLEVDTRKLDHLCAGANHQGVVALAAVKEYASVEDIFALAEERGEPPFLLVRSEERRVGTARGGRRTGGQHADSVYRRMERSDTH